MRGFSLLEVIIAIAILSTGIVASVSLISRTISASSAVKNQLIAVNLAQEGIEVIHNIRHTNWINDRPWSFGLEIQGAGGCEPSSPPETASCPIIGIVDYNDTGITFAGDQRMFWDIISQHYIHGAVDEIFSRHIEISYVDDSGTPYMLINSIVVWDNTSVSVVERLYNWK